MKRIIKLFFILIIFIIILIFLHGCHSYKINTYPTPAGYEAQIEAHKRLSKNDRELKKYHRKRIKEIKKLKRKADIK